MDDTEMTFDLTHADENRAFAFLIRNLNEAGVPYKIKQHVTTITLTIHRGF